MNKALVVDVQNNKCTILFNGEFLNIKKRKDMYEGMEILFTQEDIMNKKLDVYKYWKPIAAVAMIFLLSIFSFNYYSKNIVAYSAITIDINPSIELILNQKDIVIDVIALNEDANALLTIDVEGDSVEIALHNLLNKASEAGYLPEEITSAIVITTVPLTKNAEANKEKLTYKIEVIVEEIEILDDNLVAIIEADEEELQEAIESKIPLGVIVFNDEIDTTDIESVKELFNTDQKVQVIENLNGVKIKLKKNKDGTYILNLKLVDEDEDLEELLLSIESLKGIDGDEELVAFINKTLEDIDNNNVDLDDIKDKAEVFLDKYNLDDDDDDLAELIEMIEKLENIVDVPELTSYIERAYLEIETGNANLKSLKDEAKSYWSLYKNDLDNGSGNDDQGNQSNSNNGQGHDENDDIEELIEYLEELIVIENDVELTSFINRAYLEIEAGTADVKSLKEEAKEFWSIYKNDLDNDNNHGDQDKNDDDFEELIEFLEELIVIENDVELTSFINRAYLEIEAGTADVKSLKEEAKEYWSIYKKEIESNEENKDNSNVENDDDLAELIELLEKLEKEENGADVTAYINRIYTEIEAGTADMAVFKEEVKDYLSISNDKGKGNENNDNKGNDRDDEKDHDYEDKNDDDDDDDDETSEHE